MKKQTLATLSWLATVLLGCVLARSASADMMFDPQYYRELVDASSPQTISPGTKITLKNWGEYKHFMPMAAGRIQRKLPLAHRFGSRIHDNRRTDQRFSPAQTISTRHREI